MRLGLCALTLVVASSPALAASSPQGNGHGEVQPPGSTEAACPTTMRLETENGSDFFAVFRSRANGVVDLRMRLFADDTDYVVALHGVPVGTPYAPDGVHEQWYRSQPVDVYIPGDVPTAAVVDAKLESSNVQCAPENVYIEPAGSIYKRKELESRSDSDAAIDLEMSAITTGIVATRTAATSFPCNVPFLRPLLTKAEQPALPDDSIGNEQGVVFLSVGLDDSSNVTNVAIIKSSGNEKLDASAKVAAAYSKFRTEIFACRPLASNYIFRSTFSADR